MVTRSMSQTAASSTQPLALTAAACPTDPMCYSQAVRFSQWRDAMDLEFNALLQNNTWRLVPFRPGMNVVGCKWVFRTKQKADGSIERHKARLVAKGFNQVAGQDFFDKSVLLSSQQLCSSFYRWPCPVAGCYANWTFTMLS